MVTQQQVTSKHSKHSGKTEEDEVEYGNHPTEKQLPWDMKEEEVFDSRSGETLELEQETPLPQHVPFCHQFPNTGVQYSASEQVPPTILVYKPSSAYHDVSL